MNEQEKVGGIMTKRRFRIDTGAYGGELVVGTVDEEFVKHFVEEGEGELIDHLHSLEWDEDVNKDLPKPFEDFYCWNETDDIEHCNGPYSDTEWYWTEVPADESDDWNNDIDGKEFKPWHLYDRETYHDDNDEAKEKHKVTPVLVYHTGEKGGFGSWFVETEGEDFDPLQVSYSTVATNVAEIVEDVWYSKEQLDHNMDWCDTRGKGDDVKVGWMNVDWHDTLDKIDMNEMWEGFEDSLEWRTENNES